MMRMQELDAMVEEVRNAEDFARFARALCTDLIRNPNRWQNRDLFAYLDGLAAWSEDIDGYLKNRGQVVPEQPSWKLLAEILLAAKVYE